MRILEKLKRIAFRPFDRSEHLDDGERTVENTDAFASTINPNPMGAGPATFPRTTSRRPTRGDRGISDSAARGG